VSQQYAGTANWICHPNLAVDQCRDLATTVISADGTRTLDPLAPAKNPGFDCFYVYPTTSADSGANSDLVFDQSETDTVRAQVARFAAVCRVFAPVYRSVTLGQLFSAGAEAREIAYGDVVDAWRSYVVDHNEGRGVVLIGHSQGASHLVRLVQEVISPDPAAGQLLVSAMLLGTSVPRDGIGVFPPCTSADQSGCLVSFSSYPAAMPPTTGARFGVMLDSGEPSLCVDPARLLGGDGTVDPVLPAHSSLVRRMSGLDNLTTPFVALTNAVHVSCAEANGYGYLAVEPTPAPGDVRILDGLVLQALGPTWGLHLLDANLPQNVLIELARRQAEAWSTANPP
jgi:hypothetical protein